MANRPTRILHGDQILEELKLKAYYPRKITYHEAITIRGNLAENNLYGLMIINRLLRFDYSVLNLITAEINQKINARDAPTQIDKEPVARQFSIYNRKKENSSQMHSMDVLLVLLMCCDDCLRPLLVQKLVAAKLSVPIFLPDVMDASPGRKIWILKDTDLELPIIRDRSTSETNQAAVYDSSATISFIRAGNLHRSKSKLLCEILNETHHSTFYHRDCPNSSAKRNLTNGSIEAAWFQSIGQSDNQFNCNSVTILNLRGDSCNYPQEVKFMCELSSIVVIMIDSTESLEKLYQNVFKNVSLLNTKVLLAFVSTKQATEEDSANLQLVLIEIGLLEHLSDVISDWVDNQPQNSYEWKMTVTKAIKECVKEIELKKWPTMEEVIKKSKLLEHASLSDENQYETRRQHAKVLISAITSESCRHEGIPLPMQELWHEISKLEKDMRRKVTAEDEPVGKFIEKKVQEIANLRKRQREKLTTLNEPLRQFCMLFTKEEHLMFYVNQIKLNIGRNTECNAIDIIKPSCVELRMETLLREVGQMYEAMKTTGNVGEIQNTVKKFPNRAARLLLMGQSFEILDGDAGNVPLIWLEAMFDEIKKITNDMSVFVLSVVGLQSSGKSTLLNALFGLDFPMSAGRCTRGIHFHLIPMDKATLGIKFDYLMVLDAEGFRYHGFAGNSTVRDNEMATFIVGMSDLAIISVHGETLSDMEDIFQNAAYALLRIKQTKHDVKFMQSCMFVHKNVSAPDAKEKTSEGRNVQFRFLDEMVKAAAQREGYTSVTSFKDVINFDENSHVWYLPDLWLGAPPSATLNPDYIKRVAEIRNSILDIVKKRPVKLPVSQLFFRISDLWNAILLENFVFNFRCTKEVLAHVSLNKKLQEIEWKMRTECLQQQTKITNKIMSCETVEDLEIVKKTYKKEIQNGQHISQSEAQKTLKKVLSEVEFEETRDKFEKAYEDSKQSWAKAQESETLQEIERMIDAKRKNIVNCQEILKQFESSRLKLVEDFNKKFNDGRNPSEKDIMECVERNWEQQFSEEIKMYETAQSSGRDNIAQEFDSELHKLYGGSDASKKSLGEALKLYPINSEIPLEDIAMPQVIDQDIRKTAIQVQGTVDHEKPRTIEAHEKCLELFKDCESYLDSLKGLDFHKGHAEAILKKITEFFEIRADASNDMQHDATNGEVMGNESWVSESIFKKNFILKLSAFICQYAFNKLVELKLKFLSNTDASVTMEKRYKSQAKMLLTKFSAEHGFASHLVERAKDTVFRGLGAIIVKKVCEEDCAFTNRKEFMIKILTDLAKSKQQQDYELFFKDSESFYKKSIKKHIRHELENNNRGNLCRNVIMEIVESVKLLVRKIKDAVSSAEGRNIEDWMKDFQTKVSGKIEFKMADCEVLFKRFDEKKETKTIAAAMLKEIDTILEGEIKLIEEPDFDILSKVQMTCDTIDPIAGLMKNISGCGAKCPFCSAPCLERKDHTDQSEKQSSLHYTCSERTGHTEPEKDRLLPYTCSEPKDHTELEKHRSLHYPLGVCGIVEVSYGGFGRKAQQAPPETSKHKRRELVLESCPLLIQTRKRFRSLRTQEKFDKWYYTFRRLFRKDYVRYSKYDKMFPDWYIPQASGAKQTAFDYWNWFNAQFAKQFATKYDAPCPEIQPKWKEITLEAATASLKAQINM